jgi:hypothetical protein
VIDADALARDATALGAVRLLAGDLRAAQVPRGP